MSKQLKATVPEDFAERLRDVLHVRRYQLKDAVREGLEWWMGDEWKPAARSVEPLTGEQKKIVDEVLFYLSQATAAEIHLLRTMLAMKNKTAGALHAKPRKDASH